MGLLKKNKFKEDYRETRTWRYIVYLNAQCIVVWWRVNLLN